MELKFIIDEENIKIKDFLELKGCSRKFRRQVRIKDNIYLNGEKVKNYYPVKIGDVLIIKLDEVRNPNFLENSENLDILYEDEYILAVNKRAGISIQPSRKHPDDNLISMIHSYYLNKSIVSNIHIVNRLDYLTTGIVIVAKSGFIHNMLTKSKIQKKYLCIANGIFEDKIGTIDLPIKRLDPIDIRRCVHIDGQRSITHYRVLKELNNKSLVEVNLETGRTHQIRIHFSHIGHSLVGENLYSDETGPLMLHCYSMGFIHPITKLELVISKYPNWEEI